LAGLGSLFHHGSRNLLPSPYPPSLSPLLQAQNIASPKWLPTTYAPGPLKTAACTAYYMDRFNYKYGRPSFLLASSLLQHANRPHNFLTQPSLNYLSPLQDRLPHARFCSHFQLVSRLYIAVLTYTSGLSSLWPLKRRPPLYCAVAPNLFGWDVDMLVPDDKPATIRTAEHYRQYRQQLARKGVTNPMPFLLRTTSKESSYAGRSMISRWPIPYGQDF